MCCILVPAAFIPNVFGTIMEYQQIFRALVFGKKYLKRVLIEVDRCFYCKRLLISVILVTVIYVTVISYLISICARGFS